MDIKFDCRYFRGAVPCGPHKLHQVECSDDCPYFQPTNSNILIIKLGAMGDVIRTTPILHRIKKDYSAARIFWLSIYPDVLPVEVDWPLKFNLENVTWLRSLEFDLALNLDKDLEACALMEQLSIQTRIGFGLRQGMPAPLDEKARHKFITGISDIRSKANTDHYLKEIFNILGWEYQGEGYLFPELGVNDAIEALGSKTPTIGLNTGCGERWTSRLWPEESWQELIRMLRSAGYRVILLGGPQEDEKNRRLAQATGATYPGYFPIREFFSLVDKCDLIVSAVTMAMHVAIGLKKPTVLFNNIFNKNEFHFFTESTVLEPEKPCECYYRPVCKYGTSCLGSIKADRVFRAVQALIK